MIVRIECSAYAPSDNFAIELNDEDGGTLQLWDRLGAVVGDEDGVMVPVEPRLVAEWCSGLRRLRMPAVAPSQVVLDAKEYKVTIMDSGTRAEFNWALEAPRGWGGLSRIVKKIEATGRSWESNQP